jgi:hypothetical protein
MPKEKIKIRKNKDSGIRRSEVGDKTEPYGPIHNGYWQERRKEMGKLDAYSIFNPLETAEAPTQEAVKGTELFDDIFSDFDADCDAEKGCMLTAGQAKLCERGKTCRKK